MAYYILFVGYVPCLSSIDDHYWSQFADKTLFIPLLSKKQREGGVFISCGELAGNYTGTMIGYHAVPVVANAYMKFIITDVNENI